MNERIKEARKARKMTQEDLGKRIGLTRTYINLIETGKKIPADRTIKDIARELDIREKWLIDGEGKMELPAADEEMTFISDLLNELDNPFADTIKAIMKTYCDCDESDKKALKSFAKDLKKNLKKESRD